jgi:cell wall-associated NlpC family hydrolase
MRAAWLAVALLIAGCAAAPVAPPADSAAPGQRIAALARAQLGRPYAPGGATPGGFDCSGLVAYTHELAGYRVPRTADAQSRGARAVDVDEIMPGDLVFFRIASNSRVDHVGVYLGDRSFVHAPGRGREVEIARLDALYYKSRLSGAGRYWVQRVE